MKKLIQIETNCQLFIIKACDKTQFIFFDSLIAFLYIYLFYLFSMNLVISYSIKPDKPYLSSARESSDKQYKEINKDFTSLRNIYDCC